MGTRLEGYIVQLYDFLILQEGYLQNWPLLWESYPHTDMPLSLKFYMLNQVSVTSITIKY